MSAGTYLVVCHVVVQAPSKEAAIEAASDLLSVGMSGANENAEDGVEFQQAYAHNVGAAS